MIFIGQEQKVFQTPWNQRPIIMSLVQYELNLVEVILLCHCLAVIKWLSGVMQDFKVAFQQPSFKSRYYLMSFCWVDLKRPLWVPYGVPFLIVLIFRQIARCIRLTSRNLTEKICLTEAMKIGLAMLQFFGIVFLFTVSSFKATQSSFFSHFLTFAQMYNRTMPNF